jgi:glyoxylase-like metal-dependent hydrolase (beta-lactamase superfamily II)
MVPLEDNHLDILGKAQRGLGLSDGELCRASGIDRDQLSLARHGALNHGVLAALASALRLRSAELIRIAERTWHPPGVSVAGLVQCRTPFHDMHVNSYLVTDGSGHAVAFDTGSDADPLLRAASDAGAAISIILLTHAHGDHIFDLDRLHEQTGAPSFAGEGEPVEGALSFQPGNTFRCGGLRIGTRLTRGHSEGGITYVVEGLDKPVAIVGDALFAGSTGGPKVSYADALDCCRREIFTLPGDTVLCPGHGPLTTVDWERDHNPFF